MSQPEPPPINSDCWVELEAVIFPPASQPVPDGNENGDQLFWVIDPNGIGHWVAGQPEQAPDTYFGHLTSANHPLPGVNTPATGVPEGEAHYDPNTNKLLVVTDGVWRSVVPSANSEFVDTDTGIIYPLGTDVTGEPLAMVVPQVSGVQSAPTGLHYGQPVIRSLPETAHPVAVWTGAGTALDPLVLRLGIPGA